MKFYGRYGDLIKQYEVPLSRMLHDILDDDHLQWHPPLIRHYTNYDHITDLDLITEFDFLPNCERFPLNICNGCGMPTEDAYLSGHLVLSHIGTCKCSNVETNLSWTCLVSGLLSRGRTSLGTSVFTFTSRIPVLHIKKYILRHHFTIYWPDCKAIPAYGLMMSVCLSVRPSVYQHFG